jgi:hypothetical protein
MDRMNHELARIRHAEIQARVASRPRRSELVGYRSGNGIMRVIRRARHLPEAA